jgi:hypothetical protein
MHTNFPGLTGRPVRGKISGREKAWIIDDMASEKTLGLAMSEIEEEPIRITEEDIAEANRLSLSCPICASAVEKNTKNPSLRAVVCANCQTLYHQTCWEQNGGKCATLGCGHDESYPYGTELGPRLTIRYSDLPKHVPKPAVSSNGRSKELKAQEKRLQREAARREFWRNLFDRIRRAIGWR